MTILLLCLLLSFCFDWEDISNTRESVSLPIQTPQISPKILRCASYFQLSSWGLDIPLKHCPSCLIYYVLNRVWFWHSALKLDCMFFKKLASFSSLLISPSLCIHVQYTQTESIHLRHFTIRTLRLNSICTESHLPNRLPAWQIDNRGNDSCRFDQIDLNRQHFQPTLRSPPKVKICDITINESSLFLKREHKLQSIRTICVDLIELTPFQPTVQMNYIFQVSRKSTSGMTNRLKGKWFMSIRWNRIHESISSLSNRKYQRQIDSSWVYWTTLSPWLQHWSELIITQLWNGYWYDLQGPGV